MVESVFELINPLREYFFKVDTKNSRKMSKRVVLVSLMLTQDKYLSS